MVASEVREGVSDSPPVIVKTNTLREKAREWRNSLKEVHTGPLIIASDVVALAAEWDRFKDEAEGLTINGWLRRELGRSARLRYFELRHRAVQELGESIRRTIHHDVAKWIVNSVASCHWAILVKMLQKARIENGHNALAFDPAQRLVLRIIGRTPKTRTCSKCIELQARIEILEEQLRAK
jgi:hypothetical protein